METVEIFKSDLAKIQEVMTRLYKEDRLTGDEMRDLAQKLQAVLDITRELNR